MRDGFSSQVLFMGLLPQNTMTTSIMYILGVLHSENDPLYLLFTMSFVSHMKW